jgi:hypothetical protein
MAVINHHKAVWEDSHDCQPLDRIFKLVGHSGFFPRPEKGHRDEVNPVSIEENPQFLFRIPCSGVVTAMDIILSKFKCCSLLK